MQQSKPPIAAKPKIQKFQTESSILKCDFESKFSCDYVKNKIGVQSGSQSFENLYSNSNRTNKYNEENHDVIEKCESISNKKHMREKHAGNSQVQQMKSKLFAQQHKQNQSDVSDKIRIGFETNKNQQKNYSKELEKCLGMRNHLNNTSNLENGKVLKRLSRSFDENLSDVPMENASLRIQQNILAAEIKHVQSNKNVSLFPQQQYEEYKVNQSIWKFIRNFCLTADDIRKGILIFNLNF